jgi:hypothetical protein
MTREAFKAVALHAVEAVTVAAEQRLSRPLPRRYILAWLGGPVIQPGDDIAELLTEAVFVSDDEIFPCVDLFLDDLWADGRLYVLCYRAGYKPCPFGEHWQYRVGGHDAGRVGPFRLSCGGLVIRLGGA